MTDSSIQLGSGGSFLFVGNSFTFGRVDPVMSYNTGNVRDLTAPVPGTTFANTTGSNPYEPHPWGGVPGLFEAFASQSGLDLDVAISARNAATLQGQYLNSNPAGWDLRSNVASQPWDVVVLQDNSTQPLPSGAGSITFAAGSSTATLTIDPTPDTKSETDETVGIQITGSSSYQTSAGLVTGTILNDDPTGPVVNPALPTITLVASPGAVLEDGAQKLVYTFTRTGPTTSALTVNFAAARDGSTAPSVATGGDFENNANQFTTSFQANTGASTTGSVSFTSNTGSTVIPAGASSVTFTLDPRPDTTVENDESIRLTLSSNANYNVGTQGPVSVTILNDDFTNTTLPNISLNLASSSVYEDGSGNLVYQFTRSGSNTAPLTVNFSVSGTATLPGNDFTVTGANGFSTPGAADPNLQSFNTYAVKFAQYATTGSADGAIPANPHANPATDVYLYETWARPNMITGALVANTDDTTGAVTNTTTTAPEYYLSLEAMTADLRAAYEGLAAANPIFAGVAPVGAAFLAAVQNGTAIRDPYAPNAGSDGKVDLWWDDNLHASKYGSYLSGLTLFGTLTGLDPRSLGAAEHVAADLGITQAVAAALQNVAAATLGFTLDAHWTAPGQVTELQGGITGLLATEGSFGFSDSDVADAHTIAVTALTPGSVGAFTAVVHTDTTGDGTGGAVNWLFTVDNSAVSFLAPGASSVEHFLVTISDANGGSAQRDIAVTLNGSYNDAPVVGGDKAIAVAQGGAVAITTADLTATDPDNADAQLAFTVTATSHGSVQVSGATVTSFTQADILAGNVKFLHDGSELDGSFSVSLSDGAASGGSATVSATVNDAPVNNIPNGGLFSTGGQDSTTIAGLSVTDVDAANGSETTVLSVQHGTLNVAAAGGAIVTGSGTNSVTISGTLAAIDATLLAAGNVAYHATAGFMGVDTLTMSTNDNGNTGGPAATDTDLVFINDTAQSGGGSPPGTVTGPGAFTYHSPVDLNGDGMGDILFRQTAGTIDTWLLNGPVKQVDQVVSALGNDWHVAAKDDFNGDDKTDILLRHDNGTVALWTMNGATKTADQIVSPLGNDWHIAATDDFNGDGKSDILLRHDNGTIALWTMNGATKAADQIVSALGNDWHIAATDDFNGDGKSDILLRHDNGTIALWTLNGATKAADQIVSALGNDWHIATTADFNGDGKTDILLRHDNGTVALWTMNGATKVADQVIGPMDNSWHLLGASDFNADGHADLLWRNDNGAVEAWEMNGAQKLVEQVVSPMGNDWHFAGLTDVNNDHMTDILWRHDDGTVAVWEMNGALKVVDQVISHVGNDWVIA